MVDDISRDENDFVGVHSPRCRLRARHGATNGEPNTINVLQLVITRIQSTPPRRRQMMHPCKRNCLVALHELLVVLLLVPVAAFAAHAQQSTGVPSSSAGDKPPYNIVFLIVDQRTYRLLAGSDYSLPALDSIARHGVTFQNHYISSAMCSPSRASFLTGQPPQVNGVIDQMESCRRRHRRRRRARFTRGSGPSHFRLAFRNRSLPPACPMRSWNTRRAGTPGPA